MTIDAPNVLAEGWPNRSDFKKSIRLEFSLFLSAVVLGLMVATGYVIMRQYADSAQASVVDKLLVQARSFSGPASKHILSADGPDVLLLSDICRKLAQDNSDIYWAGIAGANGKFLAHTEVRRVIAGEPLALGDMNGKSTSVRPGESFAISRDTVYISISIEENGVFLGTLAVASSGGQIAEARRRAVYTVGSITAVMILAGIPLIMFMLHRKLRPITTITESLHAIDLQHARFEIPLQSQNEFGYLAETLRVMGTKLDAAQQEAVEKERIARELEIAHEVQESMLPRAYPQSDRFEFAGAYRSAREVGGDYYDFIDFDDEHLAFLVADVSGKSLPGMLVMLLTRDLIKRLTRTVPDPARLLTNLNRELLPNIRKGMFVTMFFGVLNKRSGLFRFASAGHNPLIVVRAEGTDLERHRPRGYPLGMMAARMFEDRLESAEIHLGPGDWLIQYTDGINEAHNPADEEFGMERFVQLLQTYRDLPPDRLVEETLRQHEAFVGTASQYDDITLLAMKWKGSDVDNNRVERKGATRVG